MKIFGLEIKRKNRIDAEPSSELISKSIEGPSAFDNIRYSNVWSFSFDGEKNVGDIGPIKDYRMDHQALRSRSWQLFVESEICQIVFKRYATWVIGKGLNLAVEPKYSILESSGIKIAADFEKQVEDRYSVYCNSEVADYSEQSSLHKLAKKAFVDAIVSGDVLVINRIDKKGRLVVQLIDGCNVVSPGINMSEDGNEIRHGVEIDKKGKHVAYWVRSGLVDVERIPAYVKGIRMAYLVYGLEHRLDAVRGIPLISAVMETAAKMDRYKEATLGSAEESAKMAFAVEHTAASTGSNPFDSKIADAIRIANGVNKTNDGFDEEGLRRDIYATTNKQAINLPVGSKLAAVESKKELYFNDFYTVNIQLVCATVGIPPEVALMKYDSNFSASRAALKDWEHTLLVERDAFSRQFYKPNYKIWLTTAVLSNKIIANGYFNAMLNGDWEILESYQTARFVGANVPHIDPLKEVNAERAKLGTLAANLPLTTLEKSTEILNGGDAIVNLNKFSEELKEASRLKLDQTLINKGAI